MESKNKIVQTEYETTRKDLYFTLLYYREMFINIKKSMTIAQLLVDRYPTPIVRTTTGKIGSAYIIIIVIENMESVYINTLSLLVLRSIHFIL